MTSIPHNATNVSARPRRHWPQNPERWVVAFSWETPSAQNGVFSRDSDGSLTVYSCYEDAVLAICEHHLMFDIDSMSMSAMIAAVEKQP